MNAGVEGLGRRVLRESEDMAAPDAGQAPGPGNQQEAQGGHIGLNGGQQRRHAAEHSDLVLDEELGEPLTEAPGVSGTRDRRCPGDPRRLDLLEGEVKGAVNALVGNASQQFGASRQLHHI